MEVIIRTALTPVSASCIDLRLCEGSGCRHDRYRMLSSPPMYTGTAFLKLRTLR